MRSPEKDQGAATSAADGLVTRETTVQESTGTVVEQTTTESEPVGITPWSQRERAASRAAIFFVGAILLVALAVGATEQLHRIFSDTPGPQPGVPWYQQVIFTILGGAIGFLFASTQRSD